MVAVELPPRAPVVRVNVAELAAGATVTDAGMVTNALVLDNAIAAPAAGAGWLRVTVQAVDAFGPRLVEVQESAERPLGAARLTVVLAEAPP